MEIKPPVKMGEIFELYLIALNRYKEIAKNKALHGKILHAVLSYSLGETLICANADNENAKSWYFELIEGAQELLNNTYFWVAVEYTTKNNIDFNSVLCEIENYIKCVFEKMDMPKTEHLKLSKHAAFLMLKMAVNNKLMSNESNTGDTND